MNKIFKFGLAVFAMLLVSAACFADIISWKDKRCEGAWVFPSDPDRGYYFTKGKVYPILYGMWYEQNIFQIDYSYEDHIHTPNIYISILEINGDTMTYAATSSEDTEYGTLKKLSKIPPKAD